ncbi:hypothetical protein BJI67_01350 [Acidihalobacter aeolianus]|uniref:Uncharacterized protein n=1 Tax=Acidihalobacter aeolianus TaxID=2792603 RepID=A0A1D8K4L2_9GAMM|nr:hypothetical protein [Acidihalobacter aeolianus]AOV15896.1 hypothetical protein BJI67_01350 [Acidihalobacter aeolianus]
MIDNVKTQKTRDPWPMITLLVVIVAAIAIAWTYYTLSSRVPPLPKQPFWTGGKDMQWNGDIRFEKTGFSEMNVQLVLGSTLHFSNPTSQPLDLAIVTWQGEKAATLKIPAGGSADWKPTQDGIYEYYDAQATQFGTFHVPGSGSAQVQQVVAAKGAPNFPAPAYGVVAVTDATGGGVPLSAKPDMTVPGGTMTYVPFVLVVKAGQTIHLTDNDGMDHSFYPGDYPVMFDDHGQIRFYHDAFRGITMHKNGGKAEITFYRPGLHHILCTIHSYPWRHTYRSHHFYGGFPYVMDAIILVEPAA